MKNLLRIFNPFNIVTVCRAIGDARAEVARGDNPAHCAHAARLAHL